MTYDYANDVALAEELLAEYGRSITLRHYTIGTYDPTTGSNTPITSDATVTGVVLDFGSGQTTERGTLIQGGDKRLLLPASAAPSLQDHVLIGGVEFTIVSIGEINPGGTSIIFDLHLRT